MNRNAALGAPRFFVNDLDLTRYHPEFRDARMLSDLSHRSVEFVTFRQL
jgi:hypothetical protein